MSVILLLAKLLRSNLLRQYGAIASYHGTQRQMLLRRLPWSIMTICCSSMSWERWMLVLFIRLCTCLPMAPAKAEVMATVSYGKKLPGAVYFFRAEKSASWISSRKKSSSVMRGREYASLISLYEPICLQNFMAEQVPHNSLRILQPCPISVPVWLGLSS